MPDPTPATPPPAAVVPPPAAATPAPVKPAAEAAPATPPAAPPDPRVASGFAAITKRERALQQEKTTWKSTRDAEAKEWNERIEAAKRYEAARAAVATDPLAALKELGVTYDQVTQAQLNDGASPPDLVAQGLQEQIKALEAKLEAKEKGKEETAAKEAKELADKELVEARGIAEKQIVDLGESVELVNALGLQKYVVKLCEDHYAETEEWIAPEEVAKVAEAKLQAGEALPDFPFDNAFKQLTATKWFKSKYQPVAAVTAPAPKAAPPQSTRVLTPDKPTSAQPVVRPSVLPRASTPVVEPPTITNELRASTAYPSIDKTKPGSYREKVRAAALAAGFKGATH